MGNPPVCTSLMPDWTDTKFKETACKSLARAALEYASPVWVPYISDNINTLEKKYNSVQLDEYNNDTAKPPVFQCWSDGGGPAVANPGIHRKEGQTVYILQPFFFLFPLRDHNHQVDYFLLLKVHTRYVCVAIIHWTQTWTTGSLSCAQMFMYATANRCVRQWKRMCKESWLWEENLLPHLGIEPASAAWQSNALTNWATSHPQLPPGAHPDQYKIQTIM